MRTDVQIVGRFDLEAGSNQANHINAAVNLNRLFVLLESWLCIRDEAQLVCVRGQGLNSATAPRFGFHCTLWPNQIKGFGEDGALTGGTRRCV